MNWFILAVSALAGATTGSPPPLATQATAYQEVKREQWLDGTVAAVQQATVSAQTGGRVVELNFDVNDKVEKGMVLLRLRDNEQDARRRRAEADTSAASARLQEAQLNFDRIGALYQKNTVAKADYDRAQTTLNAAKAALTAAQAGGKESREQQDYTVIRAPYDGIVTQRQIQLGETVAPGQALFSGFSLDKLRVEVDLPQSLALQVRSAPQARIVTESGASFPASKVTLFPYADPATNTFHARIEFDSPGSTLAPGMLVKVAFATGTERVLLVPRAAIAYRGEVTAVYVQQPEGGLSLRQVRLGRVEGEQITILAGLQPDETIALDPIQAGAQLKEQQALKAASAQGAKHE